MLESEVALADTAHVLQSKHIQQLTLSSVMIAKPPGPAALPAQLQISWHMHLQRNRYTCHEPVSEADLAQSDVAPQENGEHNHRHGCQFQYHAAQTAAADSGAQGLTQAARIGFLPPSLHKGGGIRGIEGTPAQRSPP